MYWEESHLSLLWWVHRPHHQGIQPPGHFRIAVLQPVVITFYVTIQRDFACAVPPTAMHQHSLHFTIRCPAFHGQSAAGYISPTQLGANILTLNMRIVLDVSSLLSQLRIPGIFECDVFYHLRSQGFPLFDGLDCISTARGGFLSVESTFRVYFC